MERNCVRCGKPLALGKGPKKDSARRFCSMECSRIAQSDRKGTRISFTCDHCCSEVKRSTSNMPATHGGTFCSISCRMSHSRKLVACSFPACEDQVEAKITFRSDRPQQALYKTHRHKAGNYSRFPICIRHEDLIRTRIGGRRITNGRAFILSDPDADFGTRAIGNKFTRLVLFDRANNRCQRCAVELDWNATSSWQIDHVVPLYLGGLTSASNLQVLCRPCHDGKSAAEKSAATKDRHRANKANRWHTHRQKDAEIARLRARIAELEAALHAKDTENGNAPAVQQRGEGG